MDKRAVVYSDTLGLVPCQVVGRNDSRYLVRLMGATVHVPKELVFELDDGWELSGGQVVLADRSPDLERESNERKDITPESVGTANAGVL